MLKLDNSRNFIHDIFALVAAAYSVILCDRKYIRFEQALNVYFYASSFKILFLLNRLLFTKHKLDFSYFSNVAICQKLMLFNKSKSLEIVFGLHKCLNYDIWQRLILFINYIDP